MIYGYRCRTCNLEVDSTERGNTLGACPNCPTGELRRLFVVRTETMVHEHYNATLNRVVSGNRDFDEGLKRESERVSLYTGMEHRFERVDPSDRAALGVTEQGIDDSNRIRSKQGLPTFKT